MKKTLIILVFVGFSSCDVYTPYYMNIDNRTSDTIHIVFLGKSPYTMINPDYLIFPPEHKKMLYGAEGRATKNGCGYTGIKGDEVEVYTSSGRELQKEIWNVNNWDCHGGFKQGWEMNFMVTDDDLK